MVKYTINLNYGVLHHSFPSDIWGWLIYNYNQFKMAFNDPESLQWRTFVQTLGKGSKGRYEKTIINFKSYHAKVMETCPAWTMEEVFLSYMTLMYNPNMDNAPAP